MIFRRSLALRGLPAQTPFLLNFHREAYNA